MIDRLCINFAANNSLSVGAIDGSTIENDPEQLFELFYKNVREDMNPCGLRRHNGMYQWWHERFMNAFYGIQEPSHLRSWAEAPQMWLAGYRENLQ